VTTGKLLKSIYPVLKADEYIKLVRMDKNGLVILLTTKSAILVYR